MFTSSTYYGEFKQRILVPVHTTAWWLLVMQVIKQRQIFSLRTNTLNMWKPYAWWQHWCMGQTSDLLALMHYICPEKELGTVTHGGSSLEYQLFHHSHMQQRVLEHNPLRCSHCPSKIHSANWTMQVFCLCLKTWSFWVFHLASSELQGWLSPLPHHQPPKKPLWGWQKKVRGDWGLSNTPYACTTCSDGFCSTTTPTSAHCSPPTTVCLQ